MIKRFLEGKRGLALSPFFSFGWVRETVPYFLLFGGHLWLSYGFGLMYWPLFYICLGGGFIIFSRWIDWS